MRHHLDYYKTPGFAVKVLLDNLSIYKGSTIFEPCNGNGEISSLLKQNLDPITLITTNDIDSNKLADHHFDASYYNANWPNDIMYVVSNPPFNKAFEILKNAYECASIGVAFLLRLSFLEPTYNRQNWLIKNPPSSLIVLPRISFTGDGKTDSVTVAWMIWYKQGNEQKIIITGKN